MSGRRRAVVFAYHDVGVRCLLTLLARDVDVRLVVTHRDRPDERIFFASVHDCAVEHGIPVRFADDLDAAQLHALVADAHPDFLFSFYFRNLLPASMLELAPQGAFNMHGSLLPKYRGRVPINWAIIHGETETGATLHAMVAKPDAGAIVGQTAVPILPDDTAHDVFVKVVVAAEQTLWRVLPDLLAGRIETLPNDLSRGSYFGGRRPADGRIEWSLSARAIHDLVRAVAPPYPGATTTIDGLPATITRTRPRRSAGNADATNRGRLRVIDGRCVAICGDDTELDLLQVTIEGVDLDAAALADRLGDGLHPLGNASS